MFLLIYQSEKQDICIFLWNNDHRKIAAKRRNGFQILTIEDDYATSNNSDVRGCLEIIGSNRSWYFDINKVWKLIFTTSIISLYEKQLKQNFSLFLAIEHTETLLLFFASFLYL